MVKMVTSDEGQGSVDDVDSTKESDNFLADYKRVSADYANYRRRVERDLANVRKLGQRDVIVSLLRVYDDVRRFDGGDSGELSRYVKSGLDKIFVQFGVDCFGVAGEVFDYNLHEAVDVVNDVENDGVITRVVECGYLMNGELIRVAKVVVGSVSDG